MQKLLVTLSLLSLLHMPEAMASENLETDLTDGEFLLSHNFWSLEHLHGAKKITFLKGGALEIDAEHPVIESKEWKLISQSSFSIGEHVFTFDETHNCYFSRYSPEKELEDIHMGFHVIRMENKE